MINKNSLLTPEEINILKKRVKEECLRRCYDGSVMNYGSVDYDYSITPEKGVKISTEILDKLSIPLNAINSSANLKLSSQNPLIKAEDFNEIDVALTTYENKSKYSSDTGCISSCTGLCFGSCSGSCSGCGSGCSHTCYGDCDSSCKGSCETECTGNCGGNCSGTCSETCSGTCSETCGGNCSDACSGCGSGCSSTCKEACASWCTSPGCSTGCTGPTACNTACSTQEYT